MARTPESIVKAGVEKVLAEFGAWYYMPVQNGMGVSGIPDFIACIDGKFIAIETKAPGKESRVWELALGACPSDIGHARSGARSVLLKPTSIFLPSGRVRAFRLT